MKIELWYDAVAQETDILLNDVPVGKNDVYGFLYPVRNYPIQSWLYPNGSWKGVEYQIVDLARDENVNLIFHGRKCDYDDVCKCLSKCKILDLCFVEWDVCVRYDELFSTLLSTLQNNDSIIQKLLSSLKINIEYPANLDVLMEDTDCVYHINDDADLAKADDAKDISCCIVHNSFFASYDKLHDLLTLTRSLRLPPDAIFCCFDDKETKDAYEYYAQSFKRMRFRFGLENEDRITETKEKYGHPASVKLKIEKCGEIAKALCLAYSKIKEDTQSEFNKLKKNIVALDQYEKERFQTMKHLRGSLDRFRYGMEFVCKYIDILLSVSKENKDEVFHYECIDKLDENIRLYLNAKSFCEVNYGG